jgi:hypothetical protein
LFILVGALPALGDSMMYRMVFLAWSVTEIFRYLYYITRSPVAEKLRALVPVVTFPLGAFYEGYTCWQVLQATALKGVSVKAGLSMMFTTWTPFQLVCLLVVANNALGGVAAYPGFLAKAFGKKRARKGKKGDKAD